MNSHISPSYEEVTGSGEEAVDYGLIMADVDTSQWCFDDQSAQGRLVFIDFDGMCVVKGSSTLAPLFCKNCSPLYLQQDGYILDAGEYNRAGCVAVALEFMGKRMMYDAWMSGRVDGRPLAQRIPTGVSMVQFCFSVLDPDEIPDITADTRYGRELLKDAAPHCNFEVGFFARVDVCSGSCIMVDNYGR